MRAAVFLGPEKMEVKEVNKPDVKEGEVLIRVNACAICGTDVRIYYHGQKNVSPPHIIGHEIAGTIEKTGGKVTGCNAGDRVTVVTSVGCGKCKFCKKGYYNLCVDTKAIGYYYQGGFAEYICIPKESVNQNSILKLPENVSFDAASIVEALSCCINGQEYLNIEKDEIVVIFGCGPIGCMHAELAKAKGASKIYMLDIAENKLKLAERFPNIILINTGEKDPVRKILEETAGEGADVIIVAAGSKAAQEQALQLAAKKGRISYFAGLPKDDPVIRFDSNILHYKEVSVFGAFASYREQYQKALELISEGRIDSQKLITHRFPLEEIVKGIELVKAGKTLKVVVQVET